MWNQLKFYSIFRISLSSSSSSLSFWFVCCFSSFFLSILFYWVLNFSNLNLVKTICNYPSNLEIQLLQIPSFCFFHSSFFVYTKRMSGSFHSQYGAIFNVVRKQIKDNPLLIPCNINPLFFKRFWSLIFSSLCNLIVSSSINFLLKIEVEVA